MKRGAFFIALFVLSGCGSLRLSPQGCRTSGVWGEGGTNKTEIVLNESYFVWNLDREVKLKDFLSSKGIDCGEIKKMRVKMESAFFVKRELSIYVQK